MKKSSIRKPKFAVHKDIAKKEMAPSFAASSTPIYFTAAKDFEKRQDRELYPKPLIRHIYTKYGHVSMFIGDRDTAPQITDIEVKAKYRGKGYGESLFILATNYLAQNPNLDVKSNYSRFGIGTTWDMSKGFWKRLAEKYKGKVGKEVSGRFQGEWHFDSANIPKKPFDFMQRADMKIAEKEEAE